jgi:toxin YoeB
MSFSIELTEVAEKDIEKFKKTGNKKILQKIDTLLDELRQHPTSGTGKPEQLKHYDTPTWSRRISDKHRLIYRIQEDKIVVLVLSLWGHYGNK